MNHLKLVQETQITALHQADIVNRIAHHGKARKAKTKGKSVPLLRIESGVFDHVGMHKPAGKKLHPSALLADRTTVAAADQALNIKLKPRLDKREVAGAQAHCYFAAKDRTEQRLHEVNEVRNRNIAVHHHSLNLIKGVLVRGIHFFI